MEKGSFYSHHGGWEHARRCDVDCGHSMLSISQNIVCLPLLCMSRDVYRTLTDGCIHELLYM